MCGSNESCLGAGCSNETSTVLCLEIKRKKNGNKKQLDIWKERKKERAGWIW